LKLHPPTLGEQTEIIQDWWRYIKEMYIEDVLTRRDNMEIDEAVAKTMTE
jgi:hypothetical protein